MVPKVKVSRVSVQELRVVIDHIFSRLIAEGVDQIELAESDDFYWSIPKECLYDMSIKPPELNVGRLSDDWHFLSKISDMEEAFSIMFTHAAPLLQYIADRSSYRPIADQRDI
jgi:hypothetical protein